MEFFCFLKLIFEDSFWVLKTGVDVHLFPVQITGNLLYVTFKAFKEN